MKYDVTDQWTPQGEVEAIRFHYDLGKDLH